MDFYPSLPKSHDNTNNNNNNLVQKSPVGGLLQPRKSYECIY